LTSLVKKIDSTKGIKSFVIFLSDDEKLRGDVVKLAEKEKIKTTVFAVNDVVGPRQYKISKEAEITVLLYKGNTIKANHAFRKGDFNAQAVDAIVNDIPKIQK
jgi:hypothetical protein